MAALEQLVARIFTGPRVTWSALTIAGAISLALMHFGIGPDPETEIGGYAKLGSWALLVIGGSFFGVMTVFDCAKALRNRPERPKHETYLAKIAGAPESTRAMIAFFAIRNEETAWIMADYSGTFAFRSLGFGRLAMTQHGACLIEIDSSLSAWLQQELGVISNLQVSSEAQKALIKSLDQAQIAINSLHA